MEYNDIDSDLEVRINCDVNTEKASDNFYAALSNLEGEIYEFRKAVKRERIAQGLPVKATETLASLIGE